MHPNTKFVLYVTEYLTQINFKKYLNVFSQKDAFFRNIALIDHFF